MSDQPELAELVCELGQLPSHEVRYMCVQLGVGESTLEKIDEDNKNALTCITKYFQAWLDHDSRQSWIQLVEILKFNKRFEGLASKIRKKYCPSAVPVSPLSQSSNTGSSLSSLEDNASNKSSSPEFEAIFPTPSPQSDSVNQDVSDQEAQQVSLPTLAVASESKLERRRLKKILKKASSLEIKFLSVVDSANTYLTEKQRTPEELRRFKISLTRLPLSTRYKKLRFLRKEKKKITRAESIQEIFDILDLYWNYFDYSLLEYIVMKYCDTKVKKEMKRYKRKLDDFERATSVKDYTFAVPDDREFPKQISILTAKLDKDAAQCSLRHIRKIKESIAEKAALQKFGAFTRSFHTSSVELKIAFPRAARKHVEQALDKEFLQSLGIIPESVHISDVQSVRAPRALDKEDMAFLDLCASEVQGKPHAAAMPPPPPCVREELSYTIKRRDLKPVYREDSGPQLVRKYCDEIEFITRSATVSIQIEWKSEEVDFHVAGLEEGVTRAIHFIREEFLLKTMILKQSAAERAAATLSVSEQKDIKLLWQRHPVLLTQEALREHDRLTSPKELRQFACESCNHTWWRVVPSLKAVSRCRQCNTTYDALPRNKEYGIGRFVCPNEKCGYVFYEACYAKSKRKCRNCETMVSKPYIHPNEKQDFLKKAAPFCLHISKPHISTGSTIETWLSPTGPRAALPTALDPSRADQQHIHPPAVDQRQTTDRRQSVLSPAALPTALGPSRADQQHIQPPAVDQRQTTDRRQSVLSPAALPTAVDQRQTTDRRQSVLSPVVQWLSQLGHTSLEAHQLQGEHHLVDVLLPPTYTTSSGPPQLGSAFEVVPNTVANARYSDEHEGSDGSRSAAGCSSVPSLGCVSLGSTHSVHSLGSVRSFGSIRSLGSVHSLGSVRSLCM